MIILEGPDGGGKSTLAESLMNLYPGTPVIHHSSYPNDRNLFPRFAASLLSNPYGPLILDRSWLSEPIYGAAIRKGENRVSEHGRRVLERVALGRNARVINCLPSWDTVFTTWASRKEEELVEAPDHMKKVYCLYETLRSELPIIHYDRDEVDLPMRQEEGLFADCGFRGGMIGNRVNPKVLILSDKSPGALNLPFVSEIGDSAWLSKGLDLIGANERDLAWMNVLDREDNFKPLEAIAGIRPLRIVALGEAAETYCIGHGIMHETTEHPREWRYGYYSGRYPLFDIIQEALL